MRLSYNNAVYSVACWPSALLSTTIGARDTKKKLFLLWRYFFLKLYTTSAAILLLIKYYDVVLFTTVFVDNVLSIIIPLWSCPKILHIKHLCKANLCTLKSGCMESNFSNFFFFTFFIILIQNCRV